jgi:anti-sigma factor RsiW
MGETPLSCRELVELVTEYLEGALLPDDHARFEEHLGRCAPCRMHLEQMRDTIELVGRLDAHALSPQAQLDLREAFRGWPRAPEPGTGNYLSSP